MTNARPPPVQSEKRRAYLIPFNVRYRYTKFQNTIYSLTLYIKEQQDWTKGSNAILLVTYLKWFGSHRTLPVGLIAKHCAKITDYINDSKDETT